MRLIASRIAASSEHSGSLHAIGYGYEPLRLTLCETSPVANCTFYSTDAVIFGTGPVYQTFCAAWPGLGAILTEGPPQKSPEGTDLTARRDQSSNLLAMVGVRTLLRVP